MLNNRLLTVFSVCVIFVISLWSMQFVKQEFFSTLPSQQLYLKIALKSNADLHQLLTTTRILDRYIRNPAHNLEVNDTTVYMGADGPMLSTMKRASAGVNESFFLIPIKSLSKRDLAQFEHRLSRYVRLNLSDIHLQLERLVEVFEAPGKVQINISGDDSHKLYEYASKIEDAMAAIPYNHFVHNSWGGRVPSLSIDFNRYALYQVGVSVRQVVSSINGLIHGVEIGRMDRGLFRVLVILRLPKHQWNDVTQLGSLQLFSPTLKKMIALRDTQR